jgi:hypothetical protein
MYRWCGYCQKFIREREPFADFALSYGICKSCIPKASDLEVDEDKMLARAKHLKIQPADFLAGIIQPALYKIRKII